MTNEQYKRWKNFAMRMAWRGFPQMRRPGKIKLAGFVKDFFRTSLENNWLHGTDKPLAADAWNKRFEFLLARIRSWDHTDSHPTWKDSYGHSSNGPYICDIVDGAMENWNPHYWNDESYQYRRWDDLWGVRIRCCIRAGMDVACEPSMGVMGFTAGDLRRMYRGKVPTWVMGEEPLEVQHWDGVIPGVGLIPGKREQNGTFEQLRDDEQVWL